jgi:hypothetical protein
MGVHVHTDSDFPLFRINLNPNLNPNSIHIYIHGKSVLWEDTYTLTTISRSAELIQTLT